MIHSGHDKTMHALPDDKTLVRVLPQNRNKPTFTLQVVPFRIATRVFRKAWCATAQEGAQSEVHRGKQTCSAENETRQRSQAQTYQARLRSLQTQSTASASIRNCKRHDNPPTGVLRVWLGLRPTSTPCRLFQAVRSCVALSSVSRQEAPKTVTDCPKHAKDTE